MEFVNPTREQFKILYGLKPNQPVGMLNLVRFRDIAVYAPEDLEKPTTQISGRTAYEKYSQTAEGVFQKIGVVQSWIGQPQTILIGASDELWHLAFIATYPSVKAFIDLVKSDDYQRATKHRTAAVLDSRLIVCAPLLAGNSFAPTHYLDSH